MHINRIRYQTLLAPSKMEGTVPKYFQIMLYTWPLSSLVLLFSSVTAYMCHAIYVKYKYLNCKGPSINTVSVSEVLINVVSICPYLVKTQGPIPD